MKRPANRLSSLAGIVDRSTGRTVELKHPNCLPTTVPQPVDLKGADCLVQFKEVTFHFGDKMIFDHLNFEIRSGECVVLLGPSGIGKSTLLRLLLSTLRPDSGTILFRGVDIAHLTRVELNQLRTRIGMVFQSSALISSLSVFENLALSLRELTKRSEREIRAIVEEKLQFVGLADAKDLMPSELSGGMKKRIAVARSLVMNPDLILFDEPTTGLDPIAAEHVSDLIANLNRNAAVTILVVTHDLHNAFHVATRIAVLDRGKIVEDGPPEAIRQSHNSVIERFMEAASDENFPAPKTQGQALQNT
jgi:phospholipid/cholesterol/gamma-HCH transport system ATP-binding protein